MAAYHHGALREELIRRAMVKIETGGPAALSLRDLARESGVSPSAPQKHFATKQDLLNALAVRGYEEMRRELSGVDIDGPCEQSLVALAVAYVRYVVAHPVLIQLMYGLRADDRAPDVGEAAAKAFRPAGVILDRARVRGEIIDDENLAETFLRIVVRGLAASFAEGAIAGPGNKVVEQTVWALLSGLRPR